MKNMNSKADQNSILSSLSLDEKICLLMGRSYWETIPIPRMNLSSIKIIDYLDGTRSESSAGMETKSLPLAALLAASWDPALVHRVGRQLGEEARAEGAHVLLGPTISLHRHPWGSTFGLVSEDPLLAGKLAAQYVLGVQETGVAAAIKYLSSDAQDTYELNACMIPSPRALRETYYKAFEIAVKEAPPWAVMMSYNFVNGMDLTLNKGITEAILKQQWGWKGLVINHSHWGSPLESSISSGLNLGIPRASKCRLSSQLRSALQYGRLTQDAIDEQAREILELTHKVENARNTHRDEVRNENEDELEHGQLIHDAVCQGTVLLKNDGDILPLERGMTSRIALLGLSEEHPRHEGIAAPNNSYARVTPLQPLQNAIGNSTELIYQGPPDLPSFPPLRQGLLDLYGNPGLSVFNYSSRDIGGLPDWEDSIHEARYIPIGEKWTAAALYGEYNPPVTGSHYLSISGIGATKLYIDDELVLEDPSDCKNVMSFILESSQGKIIEYPFRKGKVYRIRVETFQPVIPNTNYPTWEGLLGVIVGFMPQQQYERGLLLSAVQAAKEAEMAIICISETQTWETEGFADEDMQLSSFPTDRAQDLINAVSEVNSNVIVVVSTSVPIAMPWKRKVRAILQAWIPEQEAGEAIVEILLGDVNPSGRLPVTFPSTIEAPALYDNSNYSNASENIMDLPFKYKDDIFIGYRYYDQHPQKIEFPFGFGLSYTTFSISHTTLSSYNLYLGSSITVTAEIENTGSRSGSDVAQIYIAHAQASVPMAPKSLAGFTKTRTLLPSERERVHVTFSQDAIAWWDQSRDRWAVDAGKYTVLVARSSSERDIKAALFFDVIESFTFEP